MGDFERVSTYRRLIDGRGMDSLHMLDYRVMLEDSVSWLMIDTVRLDFSFVSTFLGTPSGISYSSGAGAFLFACMALAFIIA